MSVGEAYRSAEQAAQVVRVSLGVVSWVLGWAGGLQDGPAPVMNGLDCGCDRFEFSRVVVEEIRAILEVELDDPATEQTDVRRDVIPLGSTGIVDVVIDSNCLVIDTIQEACVFLAGQVVFDGQGHPGILGDWGCGLEAFDHDLEFIGFEMALGVEKVARSEERDKDDRCLECLGSKVGRANV